MSRVAVIGDIHGAIDEFQSLLKALEWLTLDGIYHLGDLVDRGPDSGAVVQLCREKGILGVEGNHEESILKIIKRTQAGQVPSCNDDKRHTISQLKPEDVVYLESLPLVHVFDDIKTIIVHGGLWPWIPYLKQPKNVVRCQMILSGKPDQTRWFGKDAAKHKSGKTEEENLKEGWVRWYDVYNHEYDCIFGHSVFNQPMVQQNQGFGKTIGIDTGGCFGGVLTAAVLDGGDPWFVSVKPKKMYVDIGVRQHQE